MLYWEGKRQVFYNKLADFFKEKLINEKDDSDVKKYIDKRKINKDLIDKFKIGYCSEDQNLPNHLSMMKGRLIFPIINEFGDVVAFSGRIPKDRKLLTSDEKHWFHESFPKSHFLYGLNVAWLDILKKNYAFVVEGQTDVTTMHRFGFHNTVGVLGSSLVDEGISKLTRFTNRIITIFDSDKAGRIAAARTSDILKNYKHSYDYIDVNLKNKEINYDPDEYLNKFGSKKLINRVRHYSQMSKQRREELTIKSLDEILRG